ncbi:MAG: hypothetical protein M0R28_20160 [Pigmentiphaga sp.]|nr:hypothetical protein [Pigmentiphaga sp.]
MDIESIAIDPGLIEGGQWVGDIPEMGDLRVRVRGLTSPQAVALRNRLLRALPKKDRESDGSPTQEAAMRVGGRVLLEAVLLEWDGITSGGKPVPFSKKQAEIWLTDPRYRNFGDAVAWAAQIVDKGRAEITEEIAGNSPAP